MMVSDPNQLAPTVLSEAGQRYCLNVSLYDRLYKIFQQHQEGRITQLKVQYRMHPDICMLANFFYDGKLQNDSFIKECMKRHFDHRLLFYHVADGKESRNGGTSFSIDPEGLAIRRHYENLLSTHFDNDSSRAAKSIAIITPYANQVRFLRSIFSQDTEIMTVDSTQGREKDIIILSCVRAGQNLGFVEDERRVNVALTRAREALHVFGNLEKYAAGHSIWERIRQHLPADAIRIV